MVDAERDVVAVAEDRVGQRMGVDQLEPDAQSVLRASPLGRSTRAVVGIPAAASASCIPRRRPCGCGSRAIRPGRQLRAPCSMRCAIARRPPSTLSGPTNERPDRRQPRASRGSRARSALASSPGEVGRDDGDRADLVGSQLGDRPILLRGVVSGGREDAGSPRLRSASCRPPISSPKNGLPMWVTRMPMSSVEEQHRQADRL